MSDYKVRLGDGSQIGPLDMQMLRSWYEQGLISTDSPVLTPGAGRWIPLAQAVDVRQWEGGRRGPSPRSSKGAPLPVPAASRSGPRLSTVRLSLPRLPGQTLPAAGVLVALVAAFAAYRAFTRDPMDEALRQWVAPEQRYADDSLGIALEPPRGWVLLRHENPVVPSPPEARAVLIQPRLNGAAYLVVEPSPRTVGSLERYQDELLDQRRLVNASFKPLERGPIAIGSQAGRRSVGTWQSEGKTYRELAAVWRDGWTHLALVVWLPEERASAADSELNRLLSGFSTSGAIAGRLEQAVSRAMAEAPHLTHDVALRLMGQSEAGSLEPEETFRRASLAAGVGMTALAGPEVREMGQLTSVLYGTVAAKERGRLAGYLERLRARRLTSPEEDREMCHIMKSAVLKLPEARRSRFQSLYEKAVQAGLDKG